MAYKESVSVLTLESILDVVRFCICDMVARDMSSENGCFQCCRCGFSAETQEKTPQVHKCRCDTAWWHKEGENKTILSSIEETDHFPPWHSWWELFFVKKISEVKNISLCGFEVRDQRFLDNRTIAPCWALKDDTRSVTLHLKAANSARQTEGLNLSGAFPAH